MKNGVCDQMQQDNTWFKMTWFCKIWQSFRSIQNIIQRETSRVSENIQIEQQQQKSIMSK